MTAPDDDGPDPEARAAHLARVEAVIMRMPKMTRAIFIARRFHDLSIAEIAHQTGLSRKQIMRHLNRAVAHIHDAFRET
ncbi:RNA polymerase sigma factor [Novosphingobium sp. FSW06-99]|uniref:RNA polymerase sigma factor n=1 Tax=Novosphingobium sp. FSW06-99 TaxID=1739113 RepID=UPI00076C684F|nr:sigma factor-like helix-turn-helix DNA-binding protein [Novosphingobium sp. FSW06-99]KUR78641.1 hypothetical protein AQZ49_07290 [Novosphingobium sp. FSW06-99]